MLGNKPALSGHYNWDCMVVGTLTHLIFKGQTDKENCGPMTIASFNVKQAIELAKQEGLPQYRERRAHTTLVVPARKSPTVQLKVTVPPRAMFSCSMGGAQPVALDYAADSNGESPFPKTSRCHVMRGSPKKAQPNPMWELIKWLEVCVETLREEDVLWWQLVVPLMDAGAAGTRELAKCFLTMWQWTVEVATTNFCLPTPTMLNIGQFLDEEPKEGDCMPWLLAYARALQCVGEATEGRMWHPIGMHFTLQVSSLVDTFIEEMGAELTELGITSYWGQLAVEVLL